MKPLRAINVSQRLRPAESLRVTATRTLKTVAALLGALGAIVTLAAAEPDRLAPAAIELHPVRLPAQAPRLLAMSMDDDGAIWLGSTHRIILRYQPTTGAIEEIPIPYHSSTSTCICVGAKVYLLGQSYPRLMIYDRRRKQFSEAEYPSPKPDVWYGTEAFDGRHLYLFDRSGVGVIKWDTSTEKGKAIAYPYPGPLPSFGRHFRDALWCGVWNYNGGQYVPLGIARLDLATERFSEWIAFPKDETELQPYDQPEATLFYPHSLRGQLMPFDVEKRRWCKPLAVPEFGRRFGFIGLATLFKNRWYFSLSTYNGTETGCDGKPYHFCNALLEFDPRTGTFAFPTLEAENAYFQISYTLATGGHFFATGNNIRERDGTLNAGKSGDALFWQTMRRESARAK